MTAKMTAAHQRQSLHSTLADQTTVTTNILYNILQCILTAYRQQHSAQETPKCSNDQASHTVNDSEADYNYSYFNTDYTL